MANETTHISTTPPESQDLGRGSAQPQTLTQSANTQNIGSYAGADTPARVSVKMPNSIEDITGEAQKGWMQSAKGRLAVRAFSRGILGAAFFTWGNIKVGSDLQKYDSTQSLGEQKNMLKMLAKCFDTVLGTPIQWAVTQVAGEDAGRKAVSFRPTALGSYRKDGSFNPGYSLGKEMVSRTFDFAMASVGDGLGRNIAGVFDPNVETKWLKNGKIDIKQFAKSSAHSLWTIMSKGQGEDWAVALPYVYFLRGQRNLIDKVSPGFGYDSDLGLNGGSFRVKDGKVVGNYGLEGALDLQGRFVAYNVGTLMFREGYDAAGDKLKNWKEDGFKAPDRLLPRNPVSAAVNGVKNAARYTLKSVVKGSIYMTPAVVAFWVFRTPQSRYKGAAIDPEKGMVSFRRNTYSDESHDTLIKADDVRRLETIRGDHTAGYYNSDPSKWNKLIDDHVKENTAYGVTDYSKVYHYSKVVDGGFDASGIDKKAKAIETPFDSPLNPFGRASDFDAFQFGGHNLHDPDASKAYNRVQTVKNGFDKALNPIGSGIFKLGRGIRNPMRAPLHGMGFKDQLAKKFPYVWTDAVTSYYPYMWAKWETARKWDPKNMVDKSMTLMDDSIYAMIDGAFGLNAGKFREGFQGFRTALLQRQTGKKAEARRSAEARGLAEQVPDVLPSSLYRTVEPGFAVNNTRPLVQQQADVILEETGFSRDAAAPQPVGKHTRRLSSSDFQTIARSREPAGFVAAHENRKAQESTLFPTHATPQ